MKFPSVKDVHMAPNPRQRHYLCKQRYSIHANVVYHFQSMGGAMHEHEYLAQPLEIMVLTLTVENKYRIDLDILGRNIT